MFKKFPRLLLCAMLCTALALSPLSALAQGQAIYAQMAVTLPDGSQQLIPAQTVVTSMGDTVYWVDYSTLSPEQSAALSSGMLLFTNENGEVLSSIPYTFDPSSGTVYDMPNMIVSPEDSSRYFSLMFAGKPAPQTAQEADGALGQFGFAMPTPEPTPEPEEEVSEDLWTDEMEDFLPPATENEEFNAAFRGNEIDLEYFENGYESGSTKAMTRAASLAAEKWQEVIDKAYDTLLAIADDPSAVQNDRNEWNSTKEDSIDTIIMENEGDSLSAAYEVVIFCRTKAAQLLEQIYLITGEVNLSPEAVG